MKQPARHKTIKSAAIMAALYIIFLLLLTETAARAYLSIKDNTPFLSNPARIAFKYYPALSSVDKTQPAAPGILMLGASSLKNPLYDIGAISTRILSSTPAGRGANIVNLATEAHTSLDSLHKYTAATRIRNFPVTIIYDGINDLRANNCPPGMFKPDYTHFQWYDESNLPFDRPALYRAGTFIPHFLHIARTRIRAKQNPASYIPQQRPRPEWYQYGAGIKTAAPFKHNIETIVRDAEARRNKVILITFAHYIPPGYTYEKWRAREYGKQYAFPVEMWGTPEAVEKGLAAHNNALRQIAAAHPRTVLLLDEDKQFPENPDLFIDPCHMSPNGVARLSWDIANATLSALKK